mmetsp:Transcript_25430/g.83656  ORF Transcript_25430/g.83656 Transcript_25430/m.83656 type:complete len:160 (-) Transcript_25430:176-655(-)
MLVGGQDEEKGSMRPTRVVGFLEESAGSVGLMHFCTLREQPFSSTSAPSSLLRLSPLSVAVQAAREEVDSALEGCVRRGSAVAAVEKGAVGGRLAALEPASCSAPAPPSAAPGTPGTPPKGETRGGLHTSPIEIPRVEGRAQHSRVSRRPAHLRPGERR